MTKTARAGRFVVSTVAGEECRAFLPNPLPPEPPLALTEEDYDLAIFAHPPEKVKV